MDNETLQTVVNEIAPILQNRRIGKIFQLSAHEFVIDFRPADGRYLFLNFEPSRIARLYLVRRRVRDLEKQAENASNFVHFVRKRLANAQLVRIAKEELDRVVHFAFLTEDEASGEVQKFMLVAQLTGRTANFFLLDAANTILASLRETAGAGQEIGQTYHAPPLSDNFVSDSQKSSFFAEISQVETPKSDYEFSLASPFSEKLDFYFSQAEATRSFAEKVRTVQAQLRQELGKKEKLQERLKADLKRHGEPGEWKKLGDLLLANVATARREKNRVFVTDFFDENAPEIEIEIDENSSLPEAAENFFARYTKARNAAQELSARLEKLIEEIANLKIKRETLDKIIAEKDETAFEIFSEENLFSNQKSARRSKPAGKKENEITTGVRRYRSSDDYEILVGRNSKDNDYLTMRVARSLDWWMHAADYPGSHIVVRNPQRGDLPPKTLLEAAQLAAKFSQAKDDAKVAVNYTQRKFVSKPKNAAPGLVRLASFRTILVEPKEAGERI